MRIRDVSDVLLVLVWIACPILVVLGAYFVWRAGVDERTHGPRVCGQVETHTPTGERALVEKCWRQKP